MSDLLLPKNTVSLSKSALEFATLFLEYPERRYCLGRNVYSRFLHTVLPVNGFVDDYTDDTVDSETGLKIFSRDEIPDNALMLVASGGMPLTALKSAESLGVPLLDYFSFRNCLNEISPEINLKDVMMNECFVDEFNANTDWFERIYDRLSDPVSKQTFSRLMNFRYYNDLSIMTGFYNREREQYFEDFLELNHSGEIFADVGCYDGYTSQQFMDVCPDFERIYIFEPDPTNFDQCQSRFADIDRITCYPYGLGERAETLRFSSSGSASTIDLEGDLQIEIRSLDDLLGSDLAPPTFIKMDIEGGELGALKGAKRIIQNFGPTLAISIYHSPSDIWKIPEYILSLNDNYDIYFRHYTESIYESIMFFVPNSNMK